MKKLISIVLLVSGAAFAAPNASTYYSQITFSGYTRGETLTNFPVLATFTNSNPSGFLYSQVSSPNGWDLRFSSDAAGSSLLNYEIEQWDTTKTSFVWVQVPILTNNATVYAWWGGSDTTRQTYTTNGATWDANYRAVWHLPNGATLTAKDSTTNVADGTINGAGATNGVIGGCASFSTGPKDITSSSSALNFAGPVTVAAWVYPTINNAYQAVMGRSSGYNARPYALFMSASGSGYMFFSCNNGAFNGDISLTKPWAINQWNHIEATANGTSIQIYVNGQLSGSVANPNMANLNSSATAFIGYDTGTSGYQLQGRMDEPRISSIARSTNWIWAEYMNMASNATAFQTYGAATSIGATPSKTNPYLQFFINQ